MHPDVRSESASQCPKCRMGLVKVDAASFRVQYACSRHPGLLSKRPGACWQCGEPLVATSSIRPYVVKLATEPDRPTPGNPFRITIQLLDPVNGAPVSDLHVVHEKILHFFLISEDLKEYQHVHPVQQANGIFSLEAVLPANGRYHVISDFFPIGGLPQLVRSSLIVGDAHASTSTRPKLVPDSKLVKSSAGIRFDLALAPTAPVAGTPATLAYRLTDEERGAPVRDLQPYLGAWGHTVIMSEDARHYVHSHPRVMTPSDSGQTNDDEILFDTYFPQPGRYRIWSQFQRRGRVTTVSFDIDVARAESVAVFNRHKWTPLADGLNTDFNGPVHAITVRGSVVYAAGDFTEAGSTPASHIAKWDGKRWLPVGEGLNGKVWALIATESGLYAAGEFTQAGGVQANRIAKWAGNRWHSLGSGLADCKDSACIPAVYALAANGKDLYAAGRFRKAGGSDANSIARWDGKQWHALSSGVFTGVYDGVVRSIATDGSNVYAGGTFQMAGDVRANNVAVWNGHRWNALGAGITGGLERVLAFAVFGPNVYVGGEFSHAGDIQASNIAQWTGNRWLSVGLVANAAVESIAVHQNEVHVGGSIFTLPNGELAKGLVKYTGGRWSAVGDGLASGTLMAPVTSVVLSGTRIYAAGGPFALAR